MLEKWVGVLSEQGVIGTLLVFVGYAYYKKDQRVTELNNKIIDMQEEFRKVINSIEEKRIQESIDAKKEAIKITNKVNDLIDTLSIITNKKL